MESGGAKWEEQIPELRLSESSDEEVDVGDVAGPKQKPQLPKVVEKVCKAMDNEHSTPTRLCSSENRHISNVNLRPLPDDWMVELSHEKDGLHFCDLCPAKEDKSFSSEIQLKKHLNLHHRLHRIEIHTRDDAAMSLPCFCAEDCKEPHYHCLFCDRKLVTACRYVTHLKNEHLQEKALTGLKEITPGENFQELVKDWPLDIPKLNGNCGEERRRSVDSRRDSVDSRRESISEIIGSSSPKRRYAEENKVPEEQQQSSEEEERDKIDHSPGQLVISDESDDVEGEKELDKAVYSTKTVDHQSSGEIPQSAMIEGAMEKDDKTEDPEESIAEDAGELMETEDEDIELVDASVNNDDKRECDLAETVTSDEEMEIITEEEIAAAREEDERSKEATTIEGRSEDAVEVEESDRECEAEANNVEDDDIDAHDSVMFSAEEVAAAAALAAIKTCGSPDKKKEEERSGASVSLCNNSVMSDVVEAVLETSAIDEELPSNDRSILEPEKASISLCDDSTASDVIEAPMEQSVCEEAVEESLTMETKDDSKSVKEDSESKDTAQRVNSKIDEEEEDSEVSSKICEEEDGSESNNIPLDNEEDISLKISEEEHVNSETETKEEREDSESGKVLPEETAKTCSKIDAEAEKGLESGKVLPEETASKNGSKIDKEAHKGLESGKVLPEETASKNSSKIDEEAQKGLESGMVLPEETASKDSSKIDEETEQGLESGDVDLIVKESREMISKASDEDEKNSETSDMVIDDEASEISSKTCEEEKDSEPGDIDLAGEASHSPRTGEEREDLEGGVILHNETAHETMSKIGEEKNYSEKDEKVLAEHKISEISSKSGEEEKNSERDDWALLGETNKEIGSKADEERGLVKSSGTVANETTHETSSKIKEQENISEKNDVTLTGVRNDGTSSNSDQEENENLPGQIISKTREEKCPEDNILASGNASLTGDSSLMEVDSDSETDPILEDSLVIAKDDNMKDVQDILKESELPAETLRCLSDEHKSKKEGSESEPNNSVSEDEENTTLVTRPEIEHPLREIPKDFSSNIDTPKSPEMGKEKAAEAQPPANKRGNEQVLAEREQNVNSPDSSMCDKLIEFENLSDSDNENKLKIDESRPKKKKTTLTKRKEKKHSKQPTPKQAPKKEEESNTDEFSTDYIENLIEKIDGLYKCKLCAKHGKITTEDVALAHVKNVHMKYKQVIQNKWLCLPCFRYCGESGGKEHFHCPTCLLTYSSAVALDDHCAMECSNIPRPSEQPKKAAKASEEPQKKSSKKTPKKPSPLTSKSVAPQKKVPEVAKKVADSSKKSLEQAKSREPLKKSQESLKKEVSQSTKKMSEQAKKAIEAPKKQPDSSKKVSETTKKANQSSKKAMEPLKATPEPAKKTVQTKKSSKVMESLKRESDASTKTPEAAKKLSERGKVKDISSKRDEPEIKKGKFEIQNKKLDSQQERTKRKASESLPSEKPQKVQKTEHGIPDELPTEQITRLIEALPGEFRCRLCPPVLSFKEQEQVIIHVNMKHVKHKLSLHGKWFCLPCLRDCFSADSSSHFHCPVCNETFGTAKTITLHAEEHLKQASKKKSSLPSKKKSIEKPVKGIPLSDEEMVARAASYLYKYDNFKMTYSCELCPPKDVNCKTLMEFKLHVHSCHVKFKLSTGTGGSCLPCMKHCEQFTTMHYHCPHCMDAVKDSSSFHKHLASHSSADDSSNKVQPSNKSMRLKAKENKLKAVTQQQEMAPKTPKRPPPQISSPPNTLSASKKPHSPPERKPSSACLQASLTKSNTDITKTAENSSSPRDRIHIPCSNLMVIFENNFTCTLCPSHIVFKDLESCKEHIVNTHIFQSVRMKDNGVCLPCLKDCDGGASENSHFHCPTCKCRCDSREVLYSHVERHESEELPLSISSPISTSTPMRLPVTQKLDSPETQVPIDKIASQHAGVYWCKFCVNTTFPSRNKELVKHVQSLHSNYSVVVQKKFMSIPCYKYCVGVPYAKVHYHCPVCNQVIHSTGSEKDVVSFVQGKFIAHVDIHESHALDSASQNRELILKSPVTTAAAPVVSSPSKKRGVVGSPKDQSANVSVDEQSSRETENYESMWYLCGDAYICKLCKEEFPLDEMNRLVSHIKTDHIDETVVLDHEQRCMPFKKVCNKAKQEHNHYLCPICSIVICTKAEFLMHAYSHGCSVSRLKNSASARTPVKPSSVCVRNVSVDSMETSDVDTSRSEAAPIQSYPNMCGGCFSRTSQHCHCDVCPFIGNGKDEIITHKKNTHEVIQPVKDQVVAYPNQCKCKALKFHHFHCPDCEFVTKKSTAVLLHKKVHKSASSGSQSDLNVSETSLQDTSSLSNQGPPLSKKNVSQTSSQDTSSLSKQDTPLSKLNVSQTSLQDTSSLGNQGTPLSKIISSQIGSYCQELGLTPEKLSSKTAGEIPRDKFKNGLVMDLRRFSKYKKLPRNALHEWVVMLYPAAARLSVDDFTAQIDAKWNERIKSSRSLKNVFDNQLFKLDLPPEATTGTDSIGASMHLPSQEDAEEPVRHFESVPDLSQNEDDPVNKNAIARLKKHQLLKLATEKDGRFTCQLCPKSFSTGSSPDILQHILKQHVSRGVIDATRLVLPCLRECINSGGKDNCHYHCTECKAAIVDKTDFLAHTSKHWDAKGQKATPAKVTRVVLPQKALCVDSSECIFVAPREEDSSHADYIHVRRVGRGRMMHAECEGGGPHCQKFFAGSKGGNKEECSHMKLVGMESEKLDVVALKEGAFKDISLSTTMKKQCEDLMTRAKQLSRPIICELPGKNPLSFSVWLGGKLDGFQLERGLTQADPSSKKVWCQVCSSSVCLHRCITWAYMTQRQYVTGGRLKCSGRLDHREDLKSPPEKDTPTASEKRSSSEVATASQSTSSQSEAKRPRRAGMSNVSDVMEDDADVKLSYISAELRAKVPVDAILPSEIIIPPAEGLSLDCDPRHTTHIDAFLYDDGLIEELWASGAMSRGYCVDCGSNNTRPLTLLTHSCSKPRLRYIFKALLPPLKDKIVMDVGSRLGAVLFGAHVYSQAKKIVGVEINEELVRMTRSMVIEQGMQDRIQIYLGDIRSHAALVKQAHVIVLNNVFEWFLNVKEQSKVWEFLYKNVKPGTLLVCSPSLQKTMQTIKSTIWVNRWVQEVSAHDPSYENTDKEESELKLYRVVSQ